MIPRVKLKLNSYKEWILENPEHFEMICNRCKVKFNIKRNPIYLCRRFTEMFCKDCQFFEKIGSKHWGSKEADHPHIKIMGIVEK